METAAAHEEVYAGDEKRGGDDHVAKPSCTDTTDRVDNAGASIACQHVRGEAHEGGYDHSKSDNRNYDQEQNDRYLEESWIHHSFYG